MPKPSKIKFIPATISRYRRLIRRQKPGNFSKHIEWLKIILENRNRLLFIAEENGNSVGTVRADFADRVYELSWTISPEYRGKGIGKKMVGLFATKFTEPIRNVIKLSTEYFILP